MKVCISVVALLSAACSMQAMGQTNLLLTNPSFESQSGFIGGPNAFVDETSISGWRLTGVGSGLNNGDFSQILGVTDQAANGKDGNNFAYNVRGIFETAAANRAVVTAGLTYQFSFIAEADFDNLTTSGRFSIDWYDSTSGYTPISSSSELLVIPELGQFQDFSIQGVAPVGALFAAVKYDSTNEGTGTAGTNAWFDRAVLSEVTVPSIVKGDLGGNESPDGSFNTPDGAFNDLDIEGFLLALNNQASYLALNPTLESTLVGRGDFGGNESTDGSFNTPDGAFNDLDIEGFLLALNNPAGYAAIQPTPPGGVVAIPEPATLGLLSMLGVFAGRRRR